MKRPIVSVVEEFGYHTKLGAITACSHELNDWHPGLRRRLSCFAEFAYSKNDIYKTGESDWFAFDKCTNLKLSLCNINLEEFEFEKVCSKKTISCLFCDNIVGYIDRNPLTDEWSVFLDDASTTHLPPRINVDFFNHLDLADEREYILRDITKTIFSSRQRMCFPVQFNITHAVPENARNAAIW